jgi:hypothetical protein
MHAADVARVLEAMPIALRADGADQPGAGTRHRAGRPAPGRMMSTELLVSLPDAAV